MFVPRQQYPRELKIALMREIDSGKSTAWVARNYQLSPKRLGEKLWSPDHRLRARGIAAGDLGYPKCVCLPSAAFFCGHMAIRLVI